MISGLKTLARQQLHRLLAAQGFRLQRMAPPEATGDDKSPRDRLLQHAAELPRGLVVMVPIGRCRASTGIAFDERHPFVAALADGPPDSYVGSRLEAYYRRCQPATATDVLGVPDAQAPGFAGLPPSAFVVPWHEADPETMLEHRSRWMEEEAAQAGRALTIEDGHSLFGPVSHSKGALEMERLAHLYRSMEREGFRRYGTVGENVQGWLLTESGGDWRFLVRPGQHRVSVAAALGIPSVPVWLRYAPILREAVAYWPQVSAGRISREAALDVFDRIMEGEPAPALRFVCSTVQRGEAA